MTFYWLLLGPCLTMFDIDRYQRYRWYGQHFLNSQPGGEYWDSYFPQFYRNNQCLDGCPANTHCEWGFCECDETYYKSWGLCSRVSSMLPSTNLSWIFLFRAASGLWLMSSVKRKLTLHKRQVRARNVRAQATVLLTTSTWSVGMAHLLDVSASSLSLELTRTGREAVFAEGTCVGMRWLWSASFSST